jgi:hypothetical protein
MHILCDCEAMAYLRFRHLDHYFMEPGDYHDAPISKVLRFIRSVGLIKGYIRTGRTNHDGRSARPDESLPTLYICIHTYIHIQAISCIGDVEADQYA